MSAITPGAAAFILRTMQLRCTVQNTTPAFRSAIEQALGCLERDELVSANTIISETCAHVSGVIHDCDEQCVNSSSGPCLLQADEKETRAYDVLDGLRFGFGYLYLGKLGNNVTVLS